MPQYCATLHRPNKAFPLLEQLLGIHISVLPTDPTSKSFLTLIFNFLLSLEDTTKQKNGLFIKSTLKNSPPGKEKKISLRPPKVHRGRVPMQNLLCVRANCKLWPIPEFMKSKTIRAGEVHRDQLSSPAFNFKDGGNKAQRRHGGLEQRWTKELGSRLPTHATPQLFIRPSLRE